MRKITAAVTLAVALAAGSFVTLATASAGEGHHDKDRKVTICHAAGRDGTTKYVTLTISKKAVYKDQGGHFYENGTPRAGHEQDYLGKCKPPATTTTQPPTTTTQPPTTTTTAPDEPDCTGNPDTDEPGCPIDDCALPPGNRPAECEEPPDLIPPVVIIVAPPAVPVPDESPGLAG